MKITQLFKIYWPDNGGGIAQVMETIAEGFKGEDQEIVVCRNKRNLPTVEDEYKGIPVLRCKQTFDFASTPFSGKFLREARKRSANSDVVIYHFPYPLVDLGLLFHKYGKKLAVWWHCDFARYKKLAFFYRPLVKHTLKKADIIFVSSEGNINGYPLLEKHRDKCRIIPYAVDDEYVEEGKRYMQTMAATAPLSENDADRTGKIHILFVGRMVWYKGCDVLLKAFAGLEKNRYELTMVGGGPLLDGFRKQAAELGLDNVHFTGMVSEEDKKTAIKACDYLVLPSVSEAEAFAIVQIEAMVFGKPVINTRLKSGVPYVSVDGETGITVEPGNAEQLREAMLRLGEDAEIRTRYGKAAHEKVLACYTVDKMIKDIKDELKSRV